MNSNNKLFAHFADRRWVNQWRRTECCGARVPKLINFFPADDEERTKKCLWQFVAPKGGAVVKFNHKAGGVTVLRQGARLSKKQWQIYVNGMHSNFNTGNKHIVERHYYYAEKGIMIEEMLPPDEMLGTLPIDYKLFASDGRIPLALIFAQRKVLEKKGEVVVASGPKSKAQQVWAFEPSLLSNSSRVSRDQMVYSDGVADDFTFEKPCGWEEMIKVAGCLSKGLGGVRIDMYLRNCQTYLGEITMTSAAGVTISVARGCQGECAKRVDKWLGSFISQDLPLEGLVRREHLNLNCSYAG